MPGATDWHDETLESPTGAKLHLFSAAPARKPKAVVQINHGLAEHAARYQRFAEFLTGRGFAVVAHDHRGHGHTTALDAPLGVFGAGDGFAKVLDDVTEVQNHAKARFPDAPIVCFGHSMGGIIALNHCLRRPEGLSGVAVWNTSFETPALLSVLATILRGERFFKGSDLPSSFAGKATFGAWNKEFAPNRTPFDWLSRDPAEVDKYVADPLCGFEASVGIWLSLIGAIRFGADDSHLASLKNSLPFCLVAGQADPVSEHGTAIRHLGERLKKAGLTDVAITVYPDTRHESLNEVNRDQAMGDFGDWLETHFG
jgi:alpha-beta hydrolase superfamily lysophospholipase